MPHALFFACAAWFVRDISPPPRPPRSRLAAAKVPFAGVAELADARDLGSRVERRGGSSPSARTTPGSPREVLQQRAPPTAEYHASHRNAVRGSQTRIPGQRTGCRSRGAGGRPLGRA